MLSVRQSDLTLPGRDKNPLESPDARLIEFGAFHSPRAEIDTLYAGSIIGNGANVTDSQSTIFSIQMAINASMWDNNQEGAFNTSEITMVFTKVGNMVVVYMPRISASSTIDYTGACSAFITPIDTTLEDLGLSPALIDENIPYFSLVSSTHAATYNGSKYASEISALNNDSPISPAFVFMLNTSIAATVAGGSFSLDPMYFTYYTQ